ncbi:MAG: NYN domain-containing protein [Lachnospiraceae bacterium]
MEKRFALLIDADNVSAKYIQPIINELSQYGNVTYKRIYGDWTNTQNSSWKNELLKNSISPIQQFSYTYGKNATDSAMIIDAMDILYTNKVDGFCIVSSDSDFTKLASRLRETGLTVIGMGEEKTPAPFRKACDIFTGLELLVEENGMAKEEVKEIPVNFNRKGSVAEVIEPTEESTIIDKKIIEEAIVKFITENQNSDKETSLGEVGSRLVKLYPDFDVRSYGYSLLSKFLEEFPKIKTIKRGNLVSVTLKEDISMRETIENYIIDIVKKSGQEGIDLAVLGNKIHEKYMNFKTRDYGYSQFNKYVRNIKHIEIEENDNSLKAIYKA